MKMREREGGGGSGGGGIGGGDTFNIIPCMGHKTNHPPGVSQALRSSTFFLSVCVSE